MSFEQSNVCLVTRDYVTSALGLTGGEMVIIVFRYLKVCGEKGFAKHKHVDSGGN